MSNDLTAPGALASTLIKPDDPAYLGFPPLLPLELAMQTAPVKDICEAYDITKDQLLELIENPLFAQAYTVAKESLKQDGMSFKMKARMQAEELLKKSWEMIHNEATPSNVKADLIKSTIRWAGLEPKGDSLGAGGTPFMINIHLG